MSRELKAALRERLDQNYNTFLESLQGKTTAELIAMAPEITAAQQLHDGLLDCCDEFDVEFLLRFDDPLGVVWEHWKSVVSNLGRTDQMDYMLWEIWDKGLYSEEQPAKSQKAVEGASSPVAQNKKSNKLDIRRSENPMSDELRKGAVREIISDDLRKMEGQEGLILQGCGGSIQEWVDGINGLLTDAGILQDGSKFENVSVFQHDGLTCLLFPFEDVKLDVGKLAMWRLQTHKQFGGTWLSDYVPNRLGGFIQEQIPQKPKMQLIGEDGNIFAILGRASRLLKRAGQNEQAEEMFRRVTACENYHEALRIISEYVETELSPPAIPKKIYQKERKECP